MRTRAGVMVLAVLVAVAVSLTARPVPGARAASNPPAPQPTGANPQSMKDGCGRDPLALFTRREPEWAYVYNTPAGQPAPAPRWIAGTVSAANPRFAAVHVSGGDLPTGHGAYDYNLNVLPDPGYTYLVGGDPVKKTGNYSGFDESTARLHTEWEDLTVPHFAWAEPGDHVMELGSWVWDCGHWGVGTNIFSPDYVLPKLGQPCIGIPDPSQCGNLDGEGTEFHPYRAVWVQRKQPMHAAEGEAQADLFVSTDATLAGVEADCAHQFAPSTATVDQTLKQTEYKACLDTTTPWQDVSGDYSFLLPAPAPTAPGARLVFHAVDRGSSNAPAPRLTAEGNAVRVRFHLSTPDRTHTLKLAYSIFAGWDVLPASAVPAHLKVVFDRLAVHRSQDPNCTLGAPVNSTCAQESRRTEAFNPTAAFTNAGQWNLYYDVQGAWGQFTVNGDGELDPTDGTIYPLTQSADIYVPPGKGWRLFVHGRECDLGDLSALSVDDQTKARLVAFADCPRDRDIATDNDVPGLLTDTYASVAASLGAHSSDGLTHRADPTSTCPDTNVHGCYSIEYHVSQVEDAATRVMAPTAVGGPPPPVQLPATTALGGAGVLAGAAALLVLILGLAGAKLRRGRA
jgi:hypothetical protein